MSEFRDVYSRITNKIIGDLEQGVRPWMRPWSADHAAGRITRPLQHNDIPYKGINVVMLWTAVTMNGYACPFRLTFKQALELGGAVRKGETSIQARQRPHLFATTGARPSDARRARV